MSGSFFFLRENDESAARLKLSGKAINSVAEGELHSEEIILWFVTSLYFHITSAACYYDKLLLS